MHRTLSVKAAPAVMQEEHEGTGRRASSRRTNLHQEEGRSHPTELYRSEVQLRTQLTLNVIMSKCNVSAGQSGHLDMTNISYAYIPVFEN